MSWTDVNASKSPWTIERINLLTALWNDGYSASECAAAIGPEFTRNAIIGKVNRLKLPHRQTVKVKAGSSWSPEARERARRRSEARAALQPRREAKVAKPPKPPVFVPEPEALAADAWSPLEGSTPITDIMLLTDATCRWPIGEPLEAGFGYCGCQTDEGSHYCPTHRHRAKGNGTAFERSAVKKAKQAASFDYLILDREAA